MFTDTHPALNGVPVSSGGDRVSSPGSLYQARVEVQTNISDGQAVTLYVGHVPVAYSVVTSGLAPFPGVTFDPDGQYAVQAVCTPSSGVDVSSAEVPFDVDTAAPSLLVTKVTAGDVTSPLEDADHFGLADDADLVRDGLQMRLCGTTTASDASDLDPPRDNFSVSLLPGGSLLGAGPVLGATADPPNGACVDVDCPGSGSFDIVLALEDAAGNPAEITRNNITCSSSTPLVSIVDPASPGSTPRILAADDTQPAAGAQYTVVACTNAAVGSAAALNSGLASGSLTEVATALVEADSLGGPCDASQLNIIVFTDATLDASGEDTSSYELTDPTRLEVSVTDSVTSNVGTAAQNVWVDVTVPALSLETADVCDVDIASLIDVARTLTFGTPLASATHPVTVLVTDQDGNTAPFYGTLFDAVDSETDVEVTFKLGANSWTASVTEPSGNTGSVGPCAVAVSPSPLPDISWTTPTGGTDLIAAVDPPDAPPSGAIEDADPDTAGWQGTLSVDTSIRETGVTVTFESVSADGVTTTVLGTASVDDTTGVASLTVADPVGVPEGTSLRLKARTSGGTAPSATATIIVDVDVTPPGDPTNISVDAPLNDATDPRRRVTAMQLNWTSGGDAAGYQIFMGPTEITSVDFGDAAQTEILYGGAPQAAGVDESLDVTDLYVENDYFFALRAVDPVGNRSGVLATTVAGRGSLITADIPPPVTGLGAGFGAVIDGSSDLNHDGYSDMLVGEYDGTTAYLYLGGPDGVATTPAVTFHENTDEAAEVPGFGFALAAVGDVNGDGTGDIAIGSYNEVGDGDGVTYVFYGDASWSTLSPISLDASDDADLTVTSDSTATGEPGYYYSWLGYSVARLGDFDGDGVADFAIGVPYFADGDGYLIGQVTVVLGEDRTPGTILELPTAFSDGDAIRIDGDVADGSFGTSVAGLGRFYGPDENPVLIGSAPYVGGTYGRIYAVTGDSAPSISIGGAPYLDGTIADQYLGLMGLYAVGDLGPLGNLALGVPSPSAPSQGRAYIQSGTPADGPFAASLTIAPDPLLTDNGFGRCIVGGVVPGTGTPVSFIGNARSDLLVSSRPSGSPRVYLIDGAELRLDGTEATVDTVAQVTVALPTDWAGFASQVTALRDVDADGHGDFAVGEMEWGGAIPDGRIRVYR